MKRILISCKMLAPDAGKYQPVFDAAGLEVQWRNPVQYLTEADLLPIIGEFDGMIAGDDQVTERVLRTGLPRLKAIVKWGIGMDSLDHAAAARLGIKLTNTPDTLGDVVSEYAIGYMLLLARKQHLVDRAVREGVWLRPEGFGLSARTLGIVGFGSIGQAAAAKALGLNMKVIATPSRKPKASAVIGVPTMPLEQVLAKSDYICLTCNLNSDNRHMINAKTLSMMKRGSYLINMGRGGLVDESALLEALQSNHLAGAALDVYETEPLPKDHPFTKQSNMVLGSHNSGNVRRAFEQVHRVAIKTLLDLLGIDPAPALVIFDGIESS